MYFLRKQPYYHLLEIALAEEDYNSTKQIFEEVDGDYRLGLMAKRNMYYFQDTITPAEIKEIAHHPNYFKYIYSFGFVTPENPTKLFKLIERILAEREDSVNLLKLRRKVTLFGKEVAAYDYFKIPLYGRKKITKPTHKGRYLYPALFIGQHTYLPFSDHYEKIAATAAKAEPPAALYAQCKYALVLKQPTVYKKAKQQLVEQRAIKRLNKHSSYFLFSLQALEAQQAGDYEQALIWVDSASQYMHEKGAAYFSDKTILQAEIFEEQGNFEKSIALYESINTGIVYDLMKGFATYNLGRLYEKDRQYDKAIAKSELLINLYKDCDTQYKPWVTEAMEQRDRLRAKKL